MAKVKKDQIVKLDISAAELTPPEGFTRAKFDPMAQTWPLKSSSVAEINSAYLFQRIPAAKRVNFMDEVYRILVPGGKAAFVVPYWSSPRAVQDPTAEWPPLCEQSFLYFNKEFRTANKIPLDAKCDFDFTYGYTLDPETSLKSDETRPFWIKHYTGAVSDVHVVLTKRS